MKYYFTGVIYGFFMHLRHTFFVANAYGEIGYENKKYSFEFEHHELEQLLDEKLDA